MHLKPRSHQEVAGTVIVKGLWKKEKETVEKLNGVFISHFTGKHIG